MTRLQDPDLGYTQGMCFAAAVVCLGTGDVQEKQQRFSKLMSDLRRSAKKSLRKLHLSENLEFKKEVQDFKHISDTFCEYRSCLFWCCL